MQTCMPNAPACGQYHLFDACVAIWCVADGPGSAHWAHAEPHCFDQPAEAQHCPAHCPLQVCRECGERFTVDMCAECRACVDCCACPECTDCDYKGVDVCENCDRCYDCCECFYCESCDNKVSDFCGECERCDDCCGCWLCGACDERKAEDDFRCCDCERCEDCCECNCDASDEAESASDPDGTTGPSTDPTTLETFRTCVSHTLSSDPESVDAFARNPRAVSVHFPKLGSGATKVAYDLGDGYVLKVYAVKSLGNQVRVECEYWANADAETRRYLAPIVAHAPDFKWSIQRKADVGLDYQELTELKKHLPKLRDLHAANVGRIDGQPVAFDYGLTR